jgi:hypothetical protein
MLPRGLLEYGFKFYEYCCYMFKFIVDLKKTFITFDFNLHCQIPCSLSEKKGKNSNFLHIKIDDETAIGYIFCVGYTHHATVLGKGNSHLKEPLP